MRMRGQDHVDAGHARRQLAIDAKPVMRQQHDRMRRQERPLGEQVVHPPTHQDVLVTWLIGIGYMLMDDMRELIEQGA